MNKQEFRNHIANVVECSLPDEAPANAEVEFYLGGFLLALFMVNPGIMIAGFKHFAEHASLIGRLHNTEPDLFEDSEARLRAIVAEMSKNNGH